MELLRSIQCILHLPVLLALIASATCLVPSDPGFSSVPPSIQLRPASLITNTSPPLGASSTRDRTGSTSPAFFHTLQLNLCNSGVADCYADGDSIPEGAALIYATGPTVVTINEICSNDVSELQASLRQAWPTDYTYSAFIPAVDRSTQKSYKSRGRGELERDQRVWGKYTAQYSKSGEERVFVCVAAKGEHFACTSHLAAGDKTVALAQCKALMFDAVPYLKGVAGAVRTTVVGGDFNLKYNEGAATNAQNCVPNGYTRKGDGDVQHVIFSNDLAFGSTKNYGLSYTDHDGFLVRLTAS
ncbi:hypothetical protein G7Y79_00041g077960 [Physcia stellaris]|nr:hypothetical protein G7Y79_00041g077960 [Physcia stellaris]